MLTDQEYAIIAKSSRFSCEDLKQSDYTFEQYQRLFPTVFCKVVKKELDDAAEAIAISFAHEKTRAMTMILAAILRSEIDECTTKN